MLNLLTTAAFWSIGLALGIVLPMLIGQAKSSWFWFAISTLCFVGSGEWLYLVLALATGHIAATVED